MNDYEKQNQKANLNKERMKATGLGGVASGAGVAAAIYNAEKDGEAPSSEETSHSTTEANGYVHQHPTNEQDISAETNSIMPDAINPTSENNEINILSVESAEQHEEVNIECVEYPIEGECLASDSQQMMDYLNDPIVDTLPDIPEEMSSQDYSFDDYTITLV